jgi:Holliday junction DNA helicase RuvA
MLEYIKGLLVELTPANAVVENNDIAYMIQISMISSVQLVVNQECKLFLHEVIREDSRQLYGFINKEERELFRLLISVNGVGANTARIILSGLSPEELGAAILNDNIGLLKTVKGIGAKTAQRIVIELRDKMGVVSAAENNNFTLKSNTLHDDALQALTMLGFSRHHIEKVLRNILKDSDFVSVEQVVKQALKEL